MTLRVTVLFMLAVDQIHVDFIRKPYAVPEGIVILIFFMSQTGLIMERLRNMANAHTNTLEKQMMNLLIQPTMSISTLVQMMTTNIVFQMITSMFIILTLTLMDMILIQLRVILNISMILINTVTTARY